VTVTSKRIQASTGLEARLSTGRSHEGNRPAEWKS
jgi:hypothetical protein